MLLINMIINDLHKYKIKGKVYFLSFIFPKKILWSTYLDFNKLYLKLFIQQQQIGHTCCQTNPKIRRENCICTKADALQLKPETQKNAADWKQNVLVSSSPKKKENIDTEQVEKRLLSSWGKVATCRLTPDARHICLLGCYCSNQNITNNIYYRNIVHSR